MRSETGGTPAFHSTDFDPKTDCANGGHPCSVNVALQPRILREPGFIELEATPQTVSASQPSDVLVTAPFELLFTSLLLDDHPVLWSSDDKDAGMRTVSNTDRGALADGRVARLRDHRRWRRLETRSEMCEGQVEVSTPGVEQVNSAVSCGAASSLSVTSSIFLSHLRLKSKGHLVP